MKRKLQTLTMLALTSAVLLPLSSLAADTSTPNGQTPSTGADQPTAQGGTVVAVKPGVPGGVVVDTIQTTATVTAIDKEKRKVTLQTADGDKLTVKAGPEVVNFDQIQVGDQVKTTLTEQLVVFVRKSSEPPGSAQVTTVALAPVGAKPGAIVADTTEITGKVTAIDLEKHKATIQLPDGHSKTFKVRDDVDLSKQAVGDEVVLRSTETVAIRVEKP